MLQCAAFAGPPEPAFFFSAYSGFSQPPLSEWRRNRFSLTCGLAAASRIRSQLAHTPPTGLVWGFAGVASLPCPHNRPKTAAQGRVLFSPQNELTPPPKGGGAGFCSVFGVRVPGSCLWQLLATTGSHGSNRAGLGLRLVSFPYPAPITAHRAAQGRVWFHRLFLVCFFCRQSPASWLLQLVIHRLLDGADGELQRPISHLAGFRAHLGGLHVDELPFFQAAVCISQPC